MPESKVSKASKARRERQHKRRAQNVATGQRVLLVETGEHVRSQALARNKKSQGAFSLVMSAMVAVGCWLFAYSLMLSNDPNHALFAGMAALIALMWSISFFISLRRWQKRR
jgi:hypothetical protein